MSTPRTPLYQRLPEIYHIKDLELVPRGQLQAFLAILEEVQSGVRDNIEALYHDLFIETCDDWVIPYIGDLLGTSHLSGDPWTLRADVARTVFHRRRKGTLGSIESLTFALTGWAAHSVEFLERMFWSQHLNHQRPDAGGDPPVRVQESIAEAVRGGTVTLRDPALLSFLNGPFDPFAHLADLKPVGIGSPRINLPNLGIFLWRLEAFSVPVSQPVLHDPPIALTPGDPTLEPSFAVRFDLHPQAEPMRLFNTHRFRADDDPPELSHPDAVPGPMPAARLSEGTVTGRPQDYVRVEPYAAAPPVTEQDLGLILHLPDPPFGSAAWAFRGANLCAWEEGLRPALGLHEIVIDPQLGRVVFGVDGPTAADEADPLAEGLLVSATYGFSGSTGAHPISRPEPEAGWTVSSVDFHNSPTALQDTLANVAALPKPHLIRIEDSMTHVLDLAELQLDGPLWIRAASGQRPVIRLNQPLRFRPDAATLGRPGEASLDVTLEGLYLTRTDTFGANAALIEQAALNRLRLDGCTLDPGGSLLLDGTPQGSRRDIREALRLDSDYGFALPVEQEAFGQTPEIELRRCISGPLAVDQGYRVTLSGSIVDAMAGVGETSPAMAVGAASGDPETEWGPELIVDGMSSLGRMRVTSATGRGGIWVHRLEVHDNQKGCIKFSYFSGDGDRLPPHHGCVFGSSAALSFVSDMFGQPGYCQLRLRSDRRILEEGPRHDAMGAFGYLLNSHKWKNINIRYREFMPVGIRPVLIPVT